MDQRLKIRYCFRQPAKAIAFFLIFFSHVSCQEKVKKPKIRMPVFNEKSLHNFILNSSTYSKTQSIRILDSVLDVSRLDSSVFCQTVAFLEKPLKDPNSIYRDETLYIKLLNAKIKSLWYKTEKTLLRNELNLLVQNRIGDFANDFKFITSFGLHKRLYEINADYIILFFYNPECQACQSMKSALASSIIISNQVATGKLKVLSIYIDKDVNLWRRYLFTLPKQWINCRQDDENLFQNKIYDLKAIPTIYLVKKNKRVILKDCFYLDVIENCLTTVDKKD